MGQLSQGRTNGFEISFNKNTYGRQIWEQVFKYPDVGLSFTYFDYGNDHLGQSLGAIAYVDFYLLRMGRIESKFKLGTGLGIHDKPYNHETNNQNIALGSAISESMQIRLGLNYKLSDRLKITTAFTISHFSSAAYIQPNKGLNVATANIGLKNGTRWERTEVDIRKLYCQ